jgi:predicted histone-like DNA-binding protein
MAELKFKIKKCGLVRKINDEKVKGYYGKVITNGKATFDEIARESAKNTTLHPKEASLAAELLLEGVCEKIKQGIIVDLGPLGVLYPAVSSKWERDAENLKLSDMQPKVNYAASNGIMSAVKGASLSWASEEEEKKPTTDEQAGDNEPETPGEGGDDNNGGGGEHSLGE